MQINIDELLYNGLNIKSVVAGGLYDTSSITGCNTENKK